MFSAMEIAATCIGWNGGIIHSLGQEMTTSDLCHCILTFQRSNEVIDLGCSTHKRIVTNLALFWFLEVLGPNAWLIFSHIHFYGDSTPSDANHGY